MILDIALMGTSSFVKILWFTFSRPPRLSQAQRNEQPIYSPMKRIGLITGCGL